METPTPSPKPANFPTVSRFCRALFSWKTLRRCLVGLAVLITLIVAWYTQERWRGKRAWENYRSQMAARGLELDWKKFAPPAVPDDQNFAMTPFLAPLFDFNPQPLQPGQSAWRNTNGYNRAMDFGKGVPLDFGSKRAGGAVFPVLDPTPDFEAVLQSLREAAQSDVPAGPFASRADAANELLKAFASYRPVLDELRAASRRPYSRFNLEYDAEDPMSILLPHLRVLRQITGVLAYQASAELATGKTDAAFADVEFMLYLPGTIRNEPILISQIVRIIMLENTALIVREGLAAHAWSDDQLRKFQEEFGGINVLKDMERPLEAERVAFGNRTLELMREGRENYYADQLGIAPWTRINVIRLYPAGWTYFEELNYNQMMDEQLTGYDPKAGVVHPKAVAAAEVRVKELQAAGGPSVVFHHNLFAAIAFSYWENLMHKTAAGQTVVDECAMACALERYHLADGKYPDPLNPLDALVPKFIAAIPRDVITGEPLKYRLTGDGEFIIYSVGWNETDDGGKIVMTDDGKGIDATQGDWVWPAYPKH